MVGKQMIYSPERNTQWLHNENYKSLLLCYLIIDVIIISLCWLLILFHHVRNGFPLTCPHVFPISAGFQLTLFLEVGRAVPLAPPPPICRPVPGSCGSREQPFFLLGTCISHLPVASRDQLTTIGVQEVQIIFIRQLVSILTIFLRKEDGQVFSLVV